MNTFRSSYLLQDNQKGVEVEGNCAVVSADEQCRRPKSHGNERAKKFSSQTRSAASRPRSRHTPGPHDSFHGKRRLLAKAVSCVRCWHLSFTIIIPQSNKQNTATSIGQYQWGHPVQPLPASFWRRLFFFLFST